MNVPRYLKGAVLCGESHTTETKISSVRSQTEFRPCSDRRSNVIYLPVRRVEEHSLETACFLSNPFLLSVTGGTEGVLLHSGGLPLWTTPGDRVVQVDISTCFK